MDWHREDDEDTSCGAKSRTAFAAISAVQAIVFVSMAGVSYWSTLAQWLYGAMCIVIACAGLVTWCVGSRLHMAYVVMSFISLGLLIEPLATAFADCKVPASSCDSQGGCVPGGPCPACCALPKRCRCDYLLIVIMILGGLLQAANVIMLGLFVPSDRPDSSSDRYGDRYGRSSGPQESRYERFPEPRQQARGPPPKDPERGGAGGGDTYVGGGAEADRGRLMEEARKAACNVFG